MTAPSMTPRLTPMQDTVCELLAARHRLGETIWTLSASPAMHKALAALGAAGLVSWKYGVIERTYLAWLTDAGRAEYLDESYAPPLSRAVATVEKSLRAGSSLREARAADSLAVALYPPTPKETR